MQARYINPYTDFGFKKIFGEESGKDLLIDFLNTILPEKHQIEDLSYTSTDQLGKSVLDRRAVIDLHCKTIHGETIIVEMQKAKQKYFKDRALYYSSFPIQAQAEKGTEWNFQLSAIYTIGILDFTFSESQTKDVKHTVYLKDQHNAVFYDKLLFVYLEMPNFNKELDELKTDFDRWLFVLKNLATLKKRPAALQKRVFEKLFRIAEIAQFDAEEREEYENNLKVYLDIVNVVNTSFEEGELAGVQKGLEQGLEQGITKGERQKSIQVACQMKKDGMSIATISKYTGLSVSEIEILDCT